MRSPFPGMDPYLEDPAFWPDFHYEFIGAIRAELVDLLPANYEARINEQLTLVEASPPRSKSTLPDVAITRHGDVAFAPRARSGSLVVEPVSVPLFDEREVREAWIEILHRPERQLITVIEVLSPWNKSATGLAEYLAKRRALIRQSLHLVELDLLVGGERVVPQSRLPPGDYYLIVGRQERRPNGDVYALSVRQALPELPIPLQSPDPDAIVNLQAAFTQAFERGRYGRWVDYTQPPIAALADIDRTWAHELARGRSPLDGPGP